MLELYQAEWCPHSHEVRERLTELGVDFIARQVPAEPEHRHALRERAGTDEIPVLVTEDGRVVKSAEAIRAFLEEHADERDDADTHRQKSAEKVDEFTA